MKNSVKIWKLQLSRDLSNKICNEIWMLTDKQMLDNIIVVDGIEDELESAS